MSNVLFKEKQRYKDKITIAILVIIALGTLLGALNFITGPDYSIVKCMTLILIAFSTILIIWWLRKLKLQVAISEKHIKYKMTPFHVKKQKIPWKDVEKCELVKTCAAAQWSGGNITFNHEKRITLTGRNGLALQTKQGKNYFIGFQNMDGLQDNGWQPRQ